MQPWPWKRRRSLVAAASPVHDGTYSSCCSFLVCYFFFLSLSYVFLSMQPISLDKGNGRWCWRKTKMTRSLSLYVNLLLQLRGKSQRRATKDASIIFRRFSSRHIRAKQRHRFIVWQIMCKGPYEDCLSFCQPDAILYEGRLDVVFATIFASRKFHHLKSADAADRAMLQVGHFQPLRDATPSSKMPGTQTHEAIESGVDGSTMCDTRWPLGQRRKPKCAHPLLSFLVDEVAAWDLSSAISMTIPAGLARGLRCQGDTTLGNELQIFDSCDASVFWVVFRPIKSRNTFQRGPLRIF
mmetsp:Transcript_22682/g.48107  ORF Transcript_22682/g.48107 Transcript_22682/m.48107 type:complete len:296 (-) Transcript_22682:668-1555(-)